MQNVTRDSSGAAIVAWENIWWANICVSIIFGQGRAAQVLRAEEFIFRIMPGAARHLALREATVKPAALDQVFRQSG